MLVTSAINEVIVYRSEQLLSKEDLWSAILCLPCISLEHHRSVITPSTPAKGTTQNTRTFHPSSDPLDACALEFAGAGPEFSLLALVVVRITVGTDDAQVGVSIWICVCVCVSVWLTVRWARRSSRNCCWWRTRATWSRLGTSGRGCR